MRQWSPRERLARSAARQRLRAFSGRVSCRQPDETKKRKGGKDKAPPVYLGIDGEGIGREPHRYVLLAVGEESGERNWYIENPAGLSTFDCLRFIASLPAGNAKLFAYAFNYDLTKMLQDIDDERLYRLFRPELRNGKGEGKKRGPEPIMWRGFTLNLIGSKFTVGYKGKQIVIWDIFKFYQGKFVTALQDWKVGTGETVAETERMKALRSSFKPEDMPEIRTYCFSECKDMATLAHKLVTAHEDAGLVLTSFYGAGSTASAMLKLMGIKEVLVPAPIEMRHAVASAFFGGRFENSVVGEITLSVCNWDISSAYPYQTCFLPCLLHGEWEHTTRREDLDAADVKSACVEYALGDSPLGVIRDWGPFPFREADGSICFPSCSGGGWVWKAEYLAGERFCEKRYPGAVQFKSAWIYHCKCECQPFVRIPHYYRERCRIGKEGAGIVFKLGPNGRRRLTSGSGGARPAQLGLRKTRSVSRQRRVPVLDLGRHDHVRLPRPAPRPHQPARRPQRGPHGGDRRALHHRNHLASHPYGYRHDGHRQAARRLGVGRHPARDLRGSSWHLLPPEPYEEGHQESQGARRRQGDHPRQLADDR